jgi:DNA-binding transcriptional LysR family regulator
MDLRRLDHFLTVVDCGSFGSAAKKLEMTQSGLTKSIQTLEESVGIPLFIRHARGVEPTKFGRSLAQHAKLIRSQAENALEEIKALKEGHDGTLEIGIAPTWMMGDYLSRIVADIVKNRPGLNLRIYSHVSSRALFETLLEGGLDIIIGTEQSGGEHPNCEFTQLIEDVHGMIVRKNHPLLKKRKLSVNDFDQYGWIMREEQTFYRQRFDALYFEANKPTPQPAIETNSIPLTIATVANTDYVGAARRADIDALGRDDIVMLKEPYRWMRNVSIMRRRDEPLSGAGKEFIQTLVENLPIA